MGLYFVYSPSIDSRESDFVFYFRNGFCYLLENGFLSKQLFEIVPNSLDSYKQIISYAERRELYSFEIMMLRKDKLEDVVSYLTNYLIDKDINIGLLSKKQNISFANQSMLRSFGVANNLFHRLLLLCSTKPKDDEDGLPKFVPKKHSKPKCKVCEQQKLFYSIPPKEKIKLGESFHTKFWKLLMESGKENSEVYNDAGISRQVFSKIISNKDMIPTKLTVVSLCIGLELQLPVAKELLETAGYSLSSSIMFDVIVMRYLKEEIYDCNLINEELNEYGCPLLGWHPRDN